MKYGKEGSLQFLDDVNVALSKLRGVPLDTKHPFLVIAVDEREDDFDVMGNLDEPIAANTVNLCCDAIVAATNNTPQVHMRKKVAYEHN